MSINPSFNTPSMNTIPPSSPPSSADAHKSLLAGTGCSCYWRRGPWRHTWWLPGFGRGISGIIPGSPMRPGLPTRLTDIPATRSISPSRGMNQTSSGPWTPPAGSRRIPSPWKQLRIAVNSVFRKADNTAPVSDLYLFGRKQDLAFEQPVGDSPRQRHHVRFWRWDKLEHDRPVWVGSIDVR